MNKLVILVLVFLLLTPIALNGCDYLTGEALGTSQPPGLILFPTNAAPPRWVWGAVDDSEISTIIDKYTHVLITDVSPEEAFGIIGTSQMMSNPIVVDVRTPEEYADRHIRNARNIDYSAPSFTNIINQYDRKYTYIVYCASGYRSNLAREKMETLGFKMVINIIGGFNAWIAAGLPYEK